jgi:hypothetical protein
MSSVCGYKKWRAPKYPQQQKRKGSVQEIDEKSVRIGIWF